MLNPFQFSGLVSRPIGAKQRARPPTDVLEPQITHSAVALRPGGSWAAREKNGLRYLLTIGATSMTTSVVGMYTTIDPSM